MPLRELPLALHEGNDPEARDRQPVARSL